jgi:hypothetical protein
VTGREVRSSPCKAGKPRESNFRSPRRFKTQFRLETTWRNAARYVACRLNQVAVRIGPKYRVPLSVVDRNACGTGRGDMTTSGSLPMLSGKKVIDMMQFVAGPTASRVLPSLVPTPSRSNWRRMATGRTARRQATA